MHEEGVVGSARRQVVLEGDALVQVAAAAACAGAKASAGQGESEGERALLTCGGPCTRKTAGRLKGLAAAAHRCGRRKGHLAAGRYAVRAVYVATERALAGVRFHGSYELVPTLGGTIPARILAPRPSDHGYHSPRIMRLERGHVRSGLRAGIRWDRRLS